MSNANNRKCERVMSVDLSRRADGAGCTSNGHRVGSESAPLTCVDRGAIVVLKHFMGDLVPLVQEFRAIWDEGFMAWASGTGL